MSGVVAGKLYDVGTEEPWPEREPAGSRLTRRVCTGCEMPFRARLWQYKCQPCRERERHKLAAERRAAVMPNADSSDGCGDRRRVA